MDDVLAASQTTATPGIDAHRGTLAGEAGPLLSLAVPVVAGLAASTVLSVVDSLMIGPLGELPLAAASLTQSVLVIFYSALYGLSGAVGVLVGQAHGGGQPRLIRGYLHQGLFMGFCGGFLCCLLMIALLPLLAHTGQPPEVIEAIPAYWLAMSALLVPFTLTMVVKQFFESIGRPWTGALLTLLPVLLAVPLNWLLIYGHWGFPALGLLGAGVSNFTAVTAGFFLMCLYVDWAPSMAEYRQERYVHADVLSELTREAIPMSVQYFAEGSSVAIAGVLIGLLGATALAANQIVSSVAVLVYMAPLGMAGAVSIRIAQADGEGASHRVRAIGLAGILIVTAWMLAFTAVMYVWGEDIAALFIDDRAVITSAAAMFAAIGLMQVFDGLQSVSLGALRGILDNRWASVVSLVAYWLIALPLSIVFGFVMGFGGPGIWAGFGLGLAFAGFALLFRFLGKTRRA